MQVEMLKAGFALNIPFNITKKKILKEHDSSFPFQGDCIVSIPPISQEKLVEQTLKRQLFSMFDLDLNSGSWFLE